MIMNAQPLQYGIYWDTNTRGRTRSPVLKLYTQTVFGEAKNSRPGLLPPAAADRAVGVRLMETRSRREDEKLSTETGQVQYRLSLDACAELPLAIGRFVLMTIC